MIAARDAAVTGSQRVREKDMEGIDQRTRAIPELAEGTLVLCNSPAGNDTSLASRWLGLLRVPKKVGPVS